MRVQPFRSSDVYIASLLRCNLNGYILIQSTSKIKMISSMVLALFALLIRLDCRAAMSGQNLHRKCHQIGCKGVELNDVGKYWQCISVK